MTRITDSDILTAAEKILSRKSSEDEQTVDATEIYLELFAKSKQSYEYQHRYSQVSPAKIYSVLRQNGFERSLQSQALSTRHPKYIRRVK